MNKFLKKLKISRVIILLSFIAVLFSSIIGTYGIIAAHKINDNITNMYDDGLLPIMNIAKMKDNFIDMRLNRANAQIKFDNKYIEAIEKNNNQIIKNYKEYTNTTSDETELKYLKVFEDNYKNYLEMVKESAMASKEGKILSSQKVNEIIELGIKIEKALDELQEYDVKFAEKDKFESDTIFINNRNILIIILILCILIFNLFSINIVKNLNNYLREMEEILKKMASGNLDLEIKKEGKNEFEEMKKYIGNTIEGFSNIIKSLKEKANLMSASSENLSAISEEMASSTDNVSNAINGVAEGTGEQAESLMDITNILNEFGAAID